MSKRKNTADRPNLAEAADPSNPMFQLTEAERESILQGLAELGMGPDETLHDFMQRVTGSIPNNANIDAARQIGSIADMKELAGVPKESHTEDSHVRYPAPLSAERIRRKR